MHIGQIGVFPVFRYLVFTHDRENAWKYARWKYDIDTSKLDSISYDPTLGCRAVTSINLLDIDNCTLGPGAYDSENWCASTLGHENVHGNQGYWFYKQYYNCAETQAFGWELENAEHTGMTDSEISAIQDDYDYYND